MGWRDDRRNVLRTQPEPAADDPRQNNPKNLSAAFDRSLWNGEIEALMKEIREYDPRGGCWDWVKERLADKWLQLMTAMREIDAAFDEEAADRLEQALNRTRRLYHECVSVWRSENPAKPCIPQ